MKAGDRWLIYIPYQLGYGPKGNNGIPAYSTLVFDVTLAGSYHPKTTTKENKKKN
jgi:peptidyl-prolyl cis-trans isomerase